MALTRSTCCYCGVGCGVNIETAEDDAGKTSIVGVTGDADHPANFGRLCTKGSTLHLSAREAVYDQVRGRAPMLRETKDAERQAVSWEMAEAHLAKKLAEIIKTHGPDAVGFYLSGQMLTEDYYVFNKLAKGLVGTNNVDSNSRLCMSSAVAGYKQSLGVDAPPCAYEDIDLADTLFITGSNTAFAHPILFRRIEQARSQRPDQKLIVVDVRETDTARSADLFLKILPGTDVALHHGMLHVMLENGWINQGFIADHTEGFEALQTQVHDYTPALVSRICGVAAADLIEAARWFACSKATLSLYCQGLNQSSVGTDKNTSLINLHLATGHIGKPGAGPFSLTGQPNAMGGREVGAMANLLSAHRDLANANDRAEVAAVWGLKAVPETPGLTAVPMFEALRAGQLKAIWIVCTNPAQSLPNQSLVHEALSNAELVIVQDAYANTATVPYADVFLPATTWGEKEGTVTNSERRISRVRAAVPAYADCRDDWAIGVSVARQLEAYLRPGEASLFPYATPEAVWNEHRQTTAGRDLDITGLSYALIEQYGPQQWPFAQGVATGQARLYEAGVFATPSGRARLISSTYQPTAEERDARFPFSLTTGRLRDQWHGMSRTGNLGRLFAHAPQPSIQINPDDAKRLHLENDELVYVTSRRGTQIVPVEVSEDIAPSQAFMAMHWGSEFLAGQAGKSMSHGVNTLTTDAIDPYSNQPEFKHAAVKLVKANAPWHLVAFARFDPATAIRLRNELRAVFPKVCFASVVLFGREVEVKPDLAKITAQNWLGVALRLASLEPFDPDMLRWLKATFKVDAGAVINYQDRRTHSGRYIGLAQSGEQYHIQAALLTGNVQDINSRRWLRELLESESDVKAMTRYLATPEKNMPAFGVSRGKVVCNCFNTTSQKINQTLETCADSSPESLVQSLKTQLGCGTNCGSCVPELKQMAVRFLAAKTH